MEFIRHNKILITIGSLILLTLAAVFNLYFYIFLPIQSQGDPQGFVATPLLESDHTPPPVTPTQAVSPTSMIALSIGLLLTVLAIIVLIALLRYASSKRHKRDQQRRQDLETLAKGFESYRQVHGHYPLSTTYQPDYYTAINLSNDWNYYGLPNKEQMVRFIPNWPISDPTIDYMAKTQINQYLYYPKDNGQKFALYAHLEEPQKSEAVDYNLQDTLLRSWGAYNYRIASSDYDAPSPTTPPANTTGQPQSAPTPNTPLQPTSGLPATPLTAMPASPFAATPSPLPNQIPTSPVPAPPMVDASMQVAPNTPTTPAQASTPPTTPSPTSQSLTAQPGLVMPRNMNVLQPSPTMPVPPATVETVQPPAASTPPAALPEDPSAPTTETQS